VGLNPFIVDAAAKGNVKVVELFLKVGENVNVKGSKTALTAAAARGHSELVAVLLDKGADPNMKDGSGDVALSNAGPDVRRILLSRGAKEELIRTIPMGLTATISKMEFVVSDLAERVWKEAGRRPNLETLVIKFQMNAGDRLLQDKYGNSVKGILEMGEITIGKGALDEARKYASAEKYKHDQFVRMGYEKQVANLNHSYLLK